jgi:acetylornithine deacetylase/succinyl-diaminopimelate desuccinylase-like protein
LSIGYYDHHTANEYVILEDVENGIKIGREMIVSLGCEKYKKRYLLVV